MICFACSRRSYPLMAPTLRRRPTASHYSGPLSQHVGPLPGLGEPRRPWARCGSSRAWGPGQGPSALPPGRQLVQVDVEVRDLRVPRDLLDLLRPLDLQGLLPEDLGPVHAPLGHLVQGCRPLPLLARSTSAVVTSHLGGHDGVRRAADDRQFPEDLREVPALAPGADEGEAVLGVPADAAQSTLVDLHEAG